MKEFIKIFLVASCHVFVTGCSFLDPLPSGTYNEDNYSEYPKVIRGFVDKAYSLRPSHYYATEFIGTDAGTDNAVYSNATAAMHELSVGSGQMTANPFAGIWSRDYEAINYCNMFLEDRRGLNTHYLLDEESDRVLARSLHGDAFALRAWYMYDLLKTFAGIGVNGELLGVPIITEPSIAENINLESVRRASFDDTVRQILADCDSAALYLPYNNRDYSGDPEYSTPISGSARYRCFDRISLDGLRAMVYLLWASPAFNPSNDLSLYRRAAQYASNVLLHKLEVESALTGGFNPKESFSWQNLNSPEVVNISSSMGSSTSMETNLYPIGFGGNANIVPTQDLVDAFPAANGYPISDSRSGYDPLRPYDNRDPRLDATIYHNGSEVRRNTNSELMYTFETASGCKDSPGLVRTSPTGYYVKKFIFSGWNPYDAVVVKSYNAIFFMRWEQMCLIFAESASKVIPADDESTFGISPKQALSYLRSRPTADGKRGVGVYIDPYLDECVQSPELFDALVKNEWRITTCFEGMHFFNLRRWIENPTDMSSINIPVHGVAVEENADGGFTYTRRVIENKNYPSQWCPLPYAEVRRCPNLVQNMGWENWK